MEASSFVIVDTTNDGRSEARGKKPYCPPLKPSAQYKTPTTTKAKAQEPHCPYSSTTTPWPPSSPSPPRTTPPPSSSCSSSPSPSTSSPPSYPLAPPPPHSTPTASSSPPSAPPTPPSPPTSATSLLPHLAGTPASLPHADYVLSHLRLAGLRPFHRDFVPLLSYPIRSSLSLHSRSHSPLPLLLSEPDHTVVPPYHAYSPSASLIASPVYVNYGRDEDYRALHRMGVDVRGCVLIARSGTGYRGAIVDRAAKQGAAAVFIFKEEEEEGEDARIGRGGVERGTVLLGGPGDPLTPGWAAVPGAARLEMEDERVQRRFPGIPSMPVPSASAIDVLRTLGGPPAPEGWQVAGGGRGGVGPGPTQLNFTHEDYEDHLDGYISGQFIRARKAERKLATIRNVFGVIEGREEPDRYVILGNHRDAWTYGAVDPNSGTAVLLEVARRFGTLLRMGWRPRRTILLCSWDAEEFGMIGSTEWVEQNIANLGLNAVAYLNVDCAVQGPGFFASASPQLDELLLDVMKKVKDPDAEGMTVFETWKAMNGHSKGLLLAALDDNHPIFGNLHDSIFSVYLYPLESKTPRDIMLFLKSGTWRISLIILMTPSCILSSESIPRLVGRLGRMDSDFSAFLHHAGIPSIDMYFGKDFPVYHTAFDSYDWMEKYGDPLFQRHVTVAEIWGLLALNLADSPILPFDYGSYVSQLQNHASAINDLFGNISLHPINASIDQFATAVSKVQTETQAMQALLNQADEVSVDTERRKRFLNDRLMRAERGFLEAEGLEGRPWFKHTVYAPSEDRDGSADAFPGIVDSIRRSKETVNENGELHIYHEIWRVARAIQRAAYILSGELF